MAKRRGKIDGFFEEEISLTNAPPLVKGGNDFDYCVKAFLDEKEHLRRYLLIRGQLDHDFLWISDAGARMHRRNIEFRLRH